MGGEQDWALFHWCWQEMLVPKPDRGGGREEADLRGEDRVGGL